MTNIPSVPVRRGGVHMIGIGGIGMSGIARLLLERGDKVTGCDVQSNPIIEKLKIMGAEISECHNAEHIDDSVGVVVHTSAVKENHPELAEARRRSIPVFRRAQMLADVVSDKSVIAVTGTHGKTTTSFMIAHVMNLAGFNPGFAIGGEIEELGGNAKWSESRYFVLEADESDGTQTFIKPHIAVITNIDCDHMEYYSGISHIADTMRTFIGKVSLDGLAAGCGEDEEVKKVLEDSKSENVIYGFGPENDIYAADVIYDTRNSVFNVYYKGERLGRVNLSVPGRHNILNAMACIGVCMKLGIPFNIISKGLNIYPGAKRRLDILFQNEDIIIMDDYAHHPREIKAVVDTVCRMAKGRCIGIFQPHRYTRTRLLAPLFGNCFEGLDKLILTDVYPAGESPIEGVSGRLIYDEVLRFGRPDSVYIESKDRIIDYLLPILQPKDTMLFMGAGDITETAHNMKNEYLHENDRKFARCH